MVAAGLTRYALAKETGMHWRTVDGYFHGKVAISKKVEPIIRQVIASAKKTAAKTQKASG